MYLRRVATMKSAAGARSARTFTQLLGQVWPARGWRLQRSAARNVPTYVFDKVLGLRGAKGRPCGNSILQGTLRKRFIIYFLDVTTNKSAPEGLSTKGCKRLPMPGPTPGEFGNDGAVAANNAAKMSVLSNEANCLLASGCRDLAVEDVPHALLCLSAATTGSNQH